MGAWITLTLQLHISLKQVPNIQVSVTDETLEQILDEALAAINKRNTEGRFVYEIFQHRLIKLPL